MNNNIEFLLKKPIAHRGLHNNKYLENTIESFENAINNGYPIELDVHLVKGGDIVVFHDDNLKRMCGINKRINKLTLPQIKELSLFDGSSTIPTLKEVLDVVQGQVPLLIELKNESNPKKTVMKTLEVLNEYSGKFALQSFSPLNLLWINRLAPKIPKGQLSSFHKNSKNPVKVMIKKLRFYNLTKFDFITYDIDNLPNKYVEKFKNLPLLAYTIRTKEEILKAKNLTQNYIFENIIP